LVSGQQGSAKFLKISAATILNNKKLTDFKDTNVSIEPEYIKIAMNCTHWG
jgi:hypothetical protein